MKMAGIASGLGQQTNPGGLLPRAVNFITGPSRTGDIEQQIVLGAHGPRRLHILVVENRRDVDEHGEGGGQSRAVL